VRLRAGSPLSEEAIEARLGNRTGERFDPDAASDDLARFYGLKLFGRVDFDLQHTSDDHADLVVGAEPTPTAPLHWRMGLAGEVNAGEGVNFVVGGSVRYAPTDDWGSEWRAKVELGTRLLTSLEYRYALDPAGLWYLAPSASWSKHPVRVDAGGGHLSQYSVSEVDLGLDLVREIGDVWEARAGIEYRGGDSTLDVGEPVPGNGGSFEAGGAQFALTCDSLDDLAFPSSGWLVRTNWFVPIEDFKSDQDEIVRARVDHPLPLWGGSLTLGGEFGDVVSGDGNVESFQPLGGFLRLSGLQSEAISGPTSALGRAVYTHALAPSGLERKVFTWYGGASAELGNVFGDVDEITLGRMLPSGSLFVSVDTLFGPLYLGYGLTEGGHKNLFLVLGRQF
jgi:NTE family protein